MSFLCVFRIGCRVNGRSLLRVPLNSDAGRPVVIIRGNKSFGNEKVPLIKRLLLNQQAPYTIWLCVLMLASFQIIKTVQEYKFFGQTMSQPQKRSMNVDELEKMKQRGKKVDDRKGMDSVMNQLYEDKVASKDFQEWDNIRFPRKSEPETIIAHHSRKIEKQAQKIEAADSEFELSDYVKMDEKDFQFDFENDEVIE